MCFWYQTGLPPGTGPVSSAVTRRQSVDWAEQVLLSRDRTAAGETAPACGLTLVAVGYPDQYEIPQAKPALWLD